MSQQWAIKGRLISTVYHLLPSITKPVVRTDRIFSNNAATLSTNQHQAAAKGECYPGDTPGMPQEWEFLGGVVASRFTIIPWATVSISVFLDDILADSRQFSQSRCHAQVSSTADWMLINLLPKLPICHLYCLELRRNAWEKTIIVI